MSGGGTVSPLLDFKALSSRLSSHFRIVIVEKFGYGFSDIVATSRSLDSLLQDTRMALKENNLKPPYILCPHSMSGIEALYWKQLFPNEVTAIIGLDMATPETYDFIRFNQKIFHSLAFLNRFGFSYFIPKNKLGEAFRHGELTIEEQTTYKIIFGTRFMCKTVLNEISVVKTNAKMVNIQFNNDIPMLLFVSNGKGTGFKKTVWQNLQEKFAESHKKSTLMLLDCPHYVHNYEYKTITTKILAWCTDLKIS